MNEKLYQDIPASAFEFVPEEGRMHDKKLETKPVGYFKDAMIRFSRNKGSVVAAFIILFLVLQQLEGNLIYPHVVGNSVGLPSIWVLVAVTVGGSLMGVLGMLVFIPLCSVGYALLRSWVNHRNARKATVTIPEEQPKQ